MAADEKMLQGELDEHPSRKQPDVEDLLTGFVRALIKEFEGSSDRSKGI